MSDDAVRGSHGLVEALEDGAWRTIELPQAGSNWTTLWGVSVSDNTPWAVGNFLDAASGAYRTVILGGGEDGFHVDNGRQPFIERHVVQGNSDQ